MTISNNLNNKKFDEQQIVVFAIGKEEFGINITDVREIIKWEQITRIPNTPDYVKGVINLRGGIVVVMDLALKLGLTSKEIDKNTRIIVVEHSGSAIGLVVDCATEVLRISTDKIQAAPAIITEKIQNKFVKGVGILNQRLLILLDLSNVFEDKELVQAQQKAQE